MTKIKMFSYNVRGLRQDGKRREVLHYLHMKNVDVAFLQETHFMKEILKRVSLEWGSKIWAACYSSDSRGVAILFNKKLKIDVHNTIIDEEGWFILLYVTLEGKKWVLVNIYAPNKDSSEFIDKVFSEYLRFSPD